VISPFGSCSGCVGDEWVHWKRWGGQSFLEEKRHEQAKRQQWHAPATTDVAMV
jgi:hypothetical protein